MSMLKLEVLGNIGQDATISEVSGRFCINFSIAHNRKWTDNDGVERKSTIWVNCGFWKTKREQTAIAQYLKAGTIVLVEGAPEVRMYKNKDGQMVAALQCNVASINLAGSAKTEHHAAEPATETTAADFSGSGIATDGSDGMPF